MSQNQPQVQLSGQAFIEAMRVETERMLRQVAAAVNAAPDGVWIQGSEEQVRDVLGQYRQRVFERALQMRLDAAEAAFSPSGGCAKRTTPGPPGAHAQQGPA